MQTTNKIQTGDSTTGTSTNTSYTYKSPSSYQSEKGWECPRCGRINAPWVRQCDCSPSPTSNWDKITINPCDDWWKTKIICDDNIMYTTNINQVTGGSDYKDPTTGDWVNVPKTHTNSVKR